MGKLTEPWRPAETAPKDGTKILGRNNRGNMTVVLWQEWGGRGGWVCMFSDARPHPFWNGGCGSVMTHWMPLPEQPVARSQNTPDSRGDG